MRTPFLLACLFLGLVAGTRADAPESLSVVERLRLENNTLKMAIVVQEQRQIVADIEAAHPGYTFNPKTQQLEPKPKTP